MKIAIVGTGVSGMVAAHHLHRQHEITVFEAAARIGGHTHTVGIAEPGGAAELAIDTGFIVFNDRNYPNFEALLDELGVAAQPSHMSFSVSDGRGGFEFSGTPWGLFARPAHLLSPTFLGMLREWRRFNRLAPGLIGMNGTAPSLGHWLEREGFSRHFIDRLIVPQASAVWSADPEQMWTFPASFMAEFFDNHGMYSLRDRPRWRTVAGGSSSYAEAIARPWRDRVRLAAPVRRIERLAGRGPDRGRRLRERELRPRRHRRPLRPGAAHARRPERRRARGPRRDPLPAERGRPPHRRLADAAPPRRLVELELPPRRVAARPHHGDLLDEPPAAAAHAAATTSSP